MLAGRLHPLPARRRRPTYRDPDLARRPLPATRCSVTAHHRVTGPIVLATFRDAVASARHPGLHADRQRHGLHHPLRRRQRRPQRLRDTNCAAWASPRRTPRPNHPTTCGKVERFQQTLKKWLTAQPASPPPSPSCKPCSTPSPTTTTTAARTAPCPTGPPPPPPTPPAPKPAPGDRAADTHDRVRTDRIDQTGMRHPAPRRPPAPHRHRPNPRRNPRPAARPGPRTSASSTPPPANSSANSPSTPPARLPTHRPPTRPHPKTTNSPNPCGSGRPRCLETSHGAARRDSNPQPAD